MFQLKKKKKIILLDIDGVLSPLSLVRDECYIVNLPWTTLVIPTRICDFIHEIEDKTDILWASSWEDASLQVSRDLKLNVNRYIKFNNLISVKDEWFKISGIKKFCNENKRRKILLIDDEVESTYYELNQIKNLSTIRINPLSGITNEDMKSIREWINYE